MLENPDEPRTGDQRVVHTAMHGTFAVVRSVAAAPECVFAAFSQLPLRQRWFRMPSEPGTAQHELDFRVGGGEVTHGMIASADALEEVEYRSRFLDIVANDRIVYTYELLLDGRRRSVSLVTVELSPDATGTRLTYTEQYVFLALTGDGRADVAEREGGTRLQLNGLIAVVEGWGEDPHR